MAVLFGVHRRPIHSVDEHSGCHVLTGAARYRTVALLESHVHAFTAARGRALTDTPFEIQPPSRLPAPYIVAWALLASIALCYLVLLAVRPDVASQFIFRPMDGAPENNWSQRSMSKALADLGAARTSIARLETEARELKVQLSAQEQRSHTLEVRIGAVEMAMKVGAANISYAPAPVSIKGQTEHAPSANSLSGQTVQGTVEERPTRALREASTAAQQAAMIGAPATKPAASAATPAEASGAPVGVLIASGPSVDAVRLSWQLLVERNRSALKALEPRYTESGGEQSVFRLVAGPIANREEAARVCDKLKTKQVRCSVTTFGGQPL